MKYALLLFSFAACALLPSCGAISPGVKQTVENVSDIGIDAGLDSGKLKPGMALTIQEGEQVLLSDKSGIDKLLGLGAVGLKYYVAKNHLQPGDKIVIQPDAQTAVVTTQPPGIPYHDSPNNPVLFPPDLRYPEPKPVNATD